MNPKIQPDVNPFYSAKCTPQALKKMQELREIYKALSDIIDLAPSNYTDDGQYSVGMRELSLAKTNLEQSAMWAIKAISHYNVEETKE